MCVCVVCVCVCACVRGGGGGEEGDLLLPNGGAVTEEVLQVCMHGCVLVRVCVSCHRMHV